MGKRRLLALLRKMRNTQTTSAERAEVRAEIIAVSKKNELALGQLLADEKDVGFRIDLLNIIGATQNEYFATNVRQILQSDAPIEVLQTAAINLGKLGGGETFEALVELLGHENSNLRLGAIHGLIALGDKRAIKYLLELLDDNSSVKVWWPSPKAGGYVVARESSLAIDQIAGRTFRGDKALIKEWLCRHSDR